MAVDFNDIKTRMDKAIGGVRNEFSALRTGRANANMLDSVMVEAYGSEVPLNQVGAVSVPEARSLSVNVWDGSMVKAVEKAIIDSNLGLNPQVDGNLLRINLPELNEERRLELVKVAGKFAEAGRVSVRNIRRDAMDAIKAEEKDIGKDDAKRLSEQAQKLTDEKIAEIDSLLSEKEKEIKAI